jgi:hypothetical protein
MSCLVSNYLSRCSHANVTFYAVSEQVGGPEPKMDFAGLDYESTTQNLQFEFVHTQDWMDLDGILRF